MTATTRARSRWSGWESSLRSRWATGLEPASRTGAGSPSPKWQGRRQAAAPDGAMVNRVTASGALVARLLVWHRSVMFWHRLVGPIFGRGGYIPPAPVLKRRRRHGHSLLLVKSDGVGSMASISLDRFRTAVSLLIRAAEEVGSENFALYGQEVNGATWALARMNMFLHAEDAARIEWCDTLDSPALAEGDHLMKFDVVIANPPFSLDKWGAENADTGIDPFKRFWLGTPPKSKGD